MNRARLGVNIDHVATLRQARGEFYPHIKEAAKLALESGADQITIHLREDRRHIQDSDLPIVKEMTDFYKRPLNLELGVDEEIIQIACDLKPEWICIVPEKREEKTTEGGLNLLDPKYVEKLTAAIRKLRNKTPESKISLFIEANEENVDVVKSLNIDAVEIHTGDYAKDFLEGKSIDGHLQSYKVYSQLLTDSSIGFHAGHGLTDKSLLPLVEQNLFVEYNIGHWIISQSIFEGMGSVITNLLNILEKK